MVCTVNIIKRFLSIAWCVVWLFLVWATPIQAEPLNWSYEGATNPTAWGSLTAKYSLCQTGVAQSPIDLPQIGNSESNPSSMEFNYQPSLLHIVNNGRTVQVNYDPGSNIQIEGEEYQLVQFHFHLPSEHTTAGKASAMELHLVHRSKMENIAVVAVAIEPGEANGTIETVLQYLPLRNSSDNPKIKINAEDLLPKDTAHWSYRGSLTTPPCSEDVIWEVFTQSIYLSPQQIATFANLYSGNARPTQPNNNRRIEFYQ